MKTGVYVTRFAIGGFIIPFIFALSPDMLLINTTWYEVALITITSVVGMYGLCFGLSGFKPGEKHGGVFALGIMQRVLSIAGGLMLIYPGWVTDIIGCVLVGGVLLWKKLSPGDTPANPDGMTEITA